MGQAVADAINIKEPSLSTEDSAKGVVEQVRPLIHRLILVCFDSRVADLT
jgi:hypothetical protein